jgi:hypothetical protein
MNDDTQTLIDAIHNLLEDANCVIDYERALILRETIAEIEAKAANGGELPAFWCY